MSLRILEEKPELWPYILVSIVIHAIIVALIPQLVAKAKFDEKPIEVFAVSDLPETGGQNPYRIADIPEPAVQKKPKSAKFMGMYDSEVEEELVGTAKKPGKSGEGGKTKKPADFQSAVPKQKPRMSSKDRLFAFNKAIFEDRAEKGKRSADRFEKSPGEGGAMDDFYPDFRRGAHTYLNVLRYPDVEYFVRLKRVFKVAFNPEPALADYFSRNIVTRGSIDVVLGVSVDKGGELKELFVFRASGIPSYDQEALRTVRASAPFSSPPAKFLEDDGILRMSWTFSVYL